MDYEEFMENVIREIGICPIFGGLYVVFFKAKYDFDKDYENFEELIDVNATDIEYIWLYDWYEGQQDIILEKVVRFDEIIEIYKGYQNDVIPEVSK